MNEFIVEGTPRSLQGRPAGIKEWQASVREAAVASIRNEDRLDYVDVSARIFHFCFEWGSTAGDLDNIAKPILDALVGVAFFNDNQITQLLLRRTDLQRHELTVIEGATPLLAGRIDKALHTPGGGGFVYIAVDENVDHRSLP